MKEHVFTVRITVDETESDVKDLTADCVRDALEDQGINYGLPRECVHDIKVKLVCIKNLDPKDEG